ncbi:TPA: insecticidal delta-endotoxin Cry8Ea1 family protein [Bacillus cereus]
MKYKNRTHEKRKYKKTLFATVATMTLGVGTLGNTAFAFAESKNQQEQEQTKVDAPKNQQQLAINSYYGGIDIKQAISIGADGTIKVINDQVLPKEAWFQKTLVNMGGTAFKDAALAAHNNGMMSVNNFARDMVMASTALIPYGGPIISPFIGLLWPANVEDQNNQMKKLLEHISNMVDEKIVDYDNGTLKKKTLALQDQLADFEKSIHASTSYYSTGDIQETNRTLALALNDKFRDLLMECQKEGQKTSELPIYTTVATAHLQFLKYVVDNGADDGVHTVMKFDAKTLKEQFSDRLTRAISEYPQYIQATAVEGIKKINKKCGAFPNISRSIVSQVNREYLDANRNWIKKDEIALREFEIDNPTLPNNVEKEQTEYRANTSANQAFYAVLSSVTGKKETGMVEITDTDQQYYYNKDGIRQTGWIQDGGKWYYADPKDGHIKVGWIQDEGKWYYLNANIENNDLKFGELRTGSFLDENGNMRNSEEKKTDSEQQLEFPQYISLFVFNGNKYKAVQADPEHPNDAAYARADSVREWETFQLIPVPGEKNVFALKFHANNKYVTFDRDHNGVTSANATAIGEWEKVRVSKVHKFGEDTYALQSVANNRYVTANFENGGKLNASATSIDEWEVFRIQGVSLQ